MGRQRKVFGRQNSPGDELLPPQRIQMVLDGFDGRELSKRRLAVT